jgi:ferredoxin
MRYLNTLTVFTLIALNIASGAEFEKILSKEFDLPNLRKAALYNDAEVYKGFNKFLNCRGHGLCGKCVVEIEPMENVNPRTFFENLHKLEDHQKLGCRVKVYGDITVKAAIQD